MSGVFLSYSRGDRALAEQILQGLRVLGVDVWWDEDMPGVDWQEELERQINELAGVLVLWTPHSAASKNVKDEARLGLRTDKLVNVLIGAPEPPFPFDRVNGLPLDGWSGRQPHHGWARVVQTIEALIVKAGGAKPGEITGALGRRDRALRLAQAAVEEAEHAFQDAQIHETEAVETATAASASVVHAEEQLQRMLEMRVSSAVMRTAQQELDDAQAAKDAASQLQRSAKAALSEASRALTRAKTALERLVSEPAAPPAEPETKPPPAPVRLVDVEPSLPPPIARPPEKVEPPVVGSLAPPTPKKGSGPLKGSMLVLLVGGSVAILILIRVLFSSAFSGGAAADSTASIAPTAQAAAAAAAAAAMSTPGPIADTAINGKWTLRNVSCGYAIRFALKDRVLSVDGTPVKIASTDADGALHAEADNGGDVYAAAGDTLTISPPDGGHTVYTRCAG